MVKVVRFRRCCGGSAAQRTRSARGQRPREAIGLNCAEALFRSGQYLEAPTCPGRVGYESAGVVDAVGKGVEAFRPGDVVSVVPAFSMNAYGTYGEQAIVPAHAVVKTPPGVSSVQAAALWMQYLTAYGALIEIGGLTSGDFVVVPAASSSVGLAAIQIARQVGATTIATTRTAAKKQALFGAGAPHIIATLQEDLVAEVMRLTGGRGARLVFDPVAGPYVETPAEATAKGGIIFVYGILSLQPTPFPLFKALANGLALRGYTLFEITGDPARLSRGVSFVERGLADGALAPIIARTFPLDQIVEAHRYLESNEQIGKIVVTAGRDTRARPAPA